MTPEALKACPFCGAGADEGSRGHIKVRSNGHGHWVQCWHCKTQGPAQSTDELAVMAWNTRAGADREAELVRKLTSINRILSPGHRPMDEMIRDMGYACDIARAALSPQEQDDGR